MSTNSGIQVLYGDNQSPMHPNYLANVVYANHDGVDLHLDILTQAKKGDKFQFVRMGYFCLDTKNENTFNSIVSLKDSKGK